MTTDGSIERSLADVVDRLTRAGYRDSFRGESGGVRDLSTGHLHKPEDLVIEVTDRFEGVADPEEQALVMGVRSTVDPCRGTYVVPYGKNMPPIDGELIRRIPDGRRRAS